MKIGWPLFSSATCWSCWAVAGRLEKIDVLLSLSSAVSSQGDLHLKQMQFKDWHSDISLHITEGLKKHSKRKNWQCSGEVQVSLDPVLQSYQQASLGPTEALYEVSEHLHCASGPGECTKPIAAIAYCTSLPDEAHPPACFPCRGHDPVCCVHILLDANM